MLTEFRDLLQNECSKNVLGMQWQPPRNFTVLRCLDPDIIRAQTMSALDFIVSRQRFFCRCGVYAALTINTFACGVGDKIGNGIADFGNNLANPDLVTVGGPGVRVAQGRYASPLVDPWDDDGPVIVAFEFLSDGPHLAIRPLKGRPGCNTGLAYSSIVRDKLDNLTQLIAYSEGGDTGGYGTVHFVDHQCKEYGQPVKSAKLPSVLYKDPAGYLMATRNQLLIVAPWTDTVNVLADDVSWWDVWSSSDSSSDGDSAAQKSIAVISGGHLKVFDSHHGQVADIGTSVTRVTKLGTSGAFLLTDGGVLRSYKSLSDTAPFDIASDACDPSPDAGGCLFFYAPCDSRQLLCYREESKTTIPIDSGVQSLVSTRSSQDGRLAVLYTKAAVDGSSDLWLYTTGEQPKSMVPKFAQLYSWSPPAKEIDALVNSDGVVGEAVRYTDAGQVQIASSVSAKFSQGLLANFNRDLSVGDLYSSVQLGQDPVLVAQGVPCVPDQNVIVSSENENAPDFGKATITGSDGTLGDLTLLRYPPSSSAGPESPRVISENVPIGRYRFFTYMSALAYTDSWDLEHEVGRLGLYQLDLEAKTFISDGVREFTEIFWPWEGVMYVIPDGDRAGIWVTRAK